MIFHRVQSARATLDEEKKIIITILLERGRGKKKKGGQISRYV